MPRTIATCSVMLSLAAVAAPAAAAGLLADSASVYRDARGVEVTVVFIKPRTEGNVVIHIAGSATPLDGLALPYKHTVTGSHESFTTGWHGRQFSFVQLDHRKDRESWELYVPGSLNRSRPLSYDEARTRAVQVNDLLALHEKQLKDGTIARVAAFNRAQEQELHDKPLAELAAEADKACGGHIAARILWSTVSDEVLKSYSMDSFCAGPLTALTALCRQAPIAAATLRDKVKELACSWSGPTKLTLVDGTLALSVDAQSSEIEALARKTLEAIELSPPTARSGSEQPPWGDGHTLGQRVLLAGTTVCSDDKNHYVVSVPRAPGGPQLFYGDSKKLARVPVADLLGNGTFFEPRCFNPQASSNFRGADVRFFSTVQLDQAHKTCRVQCGTRKTELKIVPATDAEPLLAAAAYVPPLDRRAPHTLNRDDTGTYYYVDKGATPETSQDFHLYVGPKGGMKLQRMTNVVSDSQGEIFSTKTGSLRFIVGPAGRESAWVRGTSKTSLLMVPVEENWQLIYNELGVYAGQRRGTPCDDL